MRFQKKELFQWHLDKYNNICVESCPVKAIDSSTKKIAYSECIECMCCHELCMYKAVKLKKDNMLAGIISKLSQIRLWIAKW